MCMHCRMGSWQGGPRPRRAACSTHHRGDKRLVARARLLVSHKQALQELGRALVGQLVEGRQGLGCKG